jgi:hypothetical protein
MPFIKSFIRAEIAAAIPVNARLEAAICFSASAEPVFHAPINAFGQRLVFGQQRFRFCV